MSENNLIGEGNSKKVYKIPAVEDYVAAVYKKEFLKRDSQKEYKFTRCPDEFEGINFGQPVASDGGGLYILKRVKGREYSLPMWLSKYQKSETGSANTTTHEAEIFFSKLKEVNSLPEKSYEDFAKKLQILNKAKIRIDSINPNNILIDSNTKEINLVDIDFKKEKFKSLKQPYNGITDMRNLLLDSLMHKKYHDKLSETKQNEMEKLSNEVIKKCKKAGEKIGLTENEYNSYEFLRLIQER